jgi:LuxR family maltose regulon positive regulatory protein
VRIADISQNEYYLLKNKKIKKEMFMPKEKQYNLRNLYFPNRITKIMNGIFDHPLTIIEAPIGYGKTTSAREYLSNAEVNMLWQRVYDSGAVSFWNGFAKLFSEFDSDRS